MSTVRPFHTKLNPTRYHDQSGCTLGDNVEDYNKVYGIDGLPRCALCISISK